MTVRKKEKEERNGESATHSDSGEPRPDVQPQQDIGDRHAFIFI